MKILEAIKKFFLFFGILFETIVYIPGYLIWIGVSRRRMNKRFSKDEKDS